MTAFCDAATTSTNGHTCRCSRLPHTGEHHCTPCGSVWHADIAITGIPDCTTAAFAAAAGYYSCPCGSTFEFDTDGTLEDFAALNRWLGRHDGSHPQCDINREGTL